MKYKIEYNDELDMFVCNGFAQRYVGDHLYDIAREHSITTTANSESHHLAIIRAHGIEVELDFDY